MRPDIRYNNIIDSDEARIALPADFMPRSWIRQWASRGDGSA